MKLPNIMTICKQPHTGKTVFSTLVTYCLGEQCSHPEKADHETMSYTLTYLLLNHL